jgi:hypothetical protein
MKVKLFWKNNPLSQGGFGLSWSSEKNARTLEDQINAWLSENPGIRIVDIKQSASGGSFGASLWFVSIWYEESAT